MDSAAAVPRAKHTPLVAAVVALPLAAQERVRDRAHLREKLMRADEDRDGYIWLDGQWLPWREAAGCCASGSNAEANQRSTFSTADAASEMPRKIRIGR